jgi:hypothetical protein
MTAAEFTTSVAGPGFVYKPGQVVGPGARYGVHEVPRAQYDAWLACGYLKVLVLPGAQESTEADPRTERAVARGGRR